MSKTYLLAALFFTVLSACGTEEKSKAVSVNDPRMPVPAPDNSMTEPSFIQACRSKGSTPINGVCTYTAQKIILSKDDPGQTDPTDPQGPKKNLLERIRQGTLNRVEVGNSVAGSVVWGDRRGGQPITILLNDVPVGVMTNDSLPKMNVAAGKVAIAVTPGNYDSIAIYVANCFTRTQPNVTCAKN